jgi:hypothetical protein
MPDIKMPTGEVVRFPDDMPKEQIKSLIASKFPELAAPKQHEAPPVPGSKGFFTGTLVPYKEDLATGERSLAVPKLLSGIMDSGYQALTLPGRVYRGETQVRGADGRISPEIIGEAANFATWASPASVASGMGPKAVKSLPQLSEGQQVANAGSRIGVALPKTMTSESTIMQSTGEALKNQPLVGSPLIRATDTAKEALGTAAKTVEQGFGSGSPVKAGADITAGITKRAKEIIPGMVGAKYDVVDSLITQNVLTPLSSTQKVASDILGKRSNAMMSGESNAVKLVNKALSAKDGLNYQGIKDLRTSIGELLDNPNQLVSSGISAAELKRVYGGLTDDLKAAVARSGGEKASKAFEEANMFAAKTSREKAALQKVLGLNPVDENVYAKITAMAGSKSRADLTGLMRARSAVSKETWDEVASAVVSNIGRDAEGVFSPDRFVTAYGSMSKSGKKLLFGNKPELAQSLDDIYTVSQRMKNISQKYGNPSGTARNAGYVAALASTWAAPIPTISGLVGGNLLSAILAKPQAAKAVAEYSKAYEMAAMGASKGAEVLLSNRAQKLAVILARESGDPRMAETLFPQLARVQPARGNDDQGNGSGGEISAPKGNRIQQDFNQAWLSGQGA